MSINTIDNAYNSFLFLMSQQMQISPEQLKEYIANPGKVNQPEIKSLLRGLTKESYTEQYKQLVLMNMEAEKTGFSKREDIQRKLDFIEKFYIANLFMLEKTKSSKVDISDEEAMERWEEIRKQNPNYRNVPLDQGLNATRQQLEMERQNLKKQELIKSIIESYKIETNPDFNLTEYFAEQKAETKETTETKEK
jgi:hypothetical protein